MSSLELIGTLLCFGAALVAIWFAQRALLATETNASPRDDHSLRDLLPKVGETGTATSEEVQLINEIGVDEPEVRRLSSEQASILLSCADYIDTVWEKDPSRNGSILSKEDREAAINLILERNGYLERVVTWQQARKGEGSYPVPNDACQAAVAYLLMERTQHRVHH